MRSHVVRIGILASVGDGSRPPGGIFAPNHKLRWVVKGTRRGHMQRAVHTPGRTAVTHVASLPATTPRGKAWAKRIARMWEECPFACPGCGRDIQLIACRLLYE